MTERKSLLLRLDPQVHDALARWANDELRSTNAQIEFLLRRALADAGRAPRTPARPARRGRPPRLPAPPDTPPGRSSAPDIPPGRFSAPDTPPDDAPRATLTGAATP